MKFIFCLTITTMLISCGVTLKSKGPNEFLDSFKESNHLDSLVKGRMISIQLDDTIYAADAPILILSAVAIGYSDDKKVKVVYKNISSKTITGIKLRWFGHNAFNDPADFGETYPGVGGGLSTNEIQSGKTDSGTWIISSKDLKKIIKAWPKEVAFADGTNWKVKQ